MTLAVISDVGGDTVTIVANSARLQLSLADAYALVNHLGFTLRELARDQVVKGRENLIRGAYCE